MTRLFIRFYLGIICILLMAFFIQSIVLRQRSHAKNLQVVEQALSGGVRLATAKLDAASPQDFGKTLTSIQQEFEYPVTLLDITDQSLWAYVIPRVKDGQVVFYDRNGSGYVAGTLADRQRALEFGPLPSFVGPSQTEVTLGYGIVLLLAALAIAILLRPVVGQLRAVEKTATAIASGDLSARISSSQLPRGLPLASAFNSMADRTETLLRSQRELLQAVSHELRTPLARIRFATDLIESATTDQERSDRLAAVDRATQDLDMLVGELLSYVRMESTDGVPQDTLFNLYDVACEEIENRRPLYPAVEFSIQHHEGERQYSICGDRVSLGRAIGNLIGNAAKFAKSEVVLNLRATDEAIMVEVDDDGPGVPLADRQRIFEPFVRLPNSTERGAGLGLALVARIVTRQGGSITVEASPQGGARFRLEFDHKAAPALPPSR